MISDGKQMFFDGKLMNSDEKTTNFGAAEIDEKQLKTGIKNALKSKLTN